MQGTGVPDTALGESEEQHRALLKATAVILWLAGPDGMITSTTGWTEFTGQSEEDALGLGNVEMIHPDDRASIAAAWVAAAAAGSSYEKEARVWHQESGQYRWMVTRAVPLKHADGSIRKWVGGLSDNHDRKRTEEQLRTSEERLRLALRAGRMLAWELHLETGKLIFSRDTHTLRGPRSWNLRDFLPRVHPDDHIRYDRFLLELKEAGVASTELRYASGNREFRWISLRAEAISDGQVVGVSFDVSDRKKAEEEVRWAANHDALTGLPNRTRFQARFDEALELARRRGTRVCLLMIDLDNFKDINDTLGHDAGDALLQEAARRLSSLTRNCDMVARLGGDEFAVLTTEAQSLGDATTLATRIHEALARPFQHTGRTFVINASIGAAAFPDHGATIVEIMKSADIALYKAKAEGRSRTVIFSSAMRQALEERTSMASEVRTALKHGLIVPFYQPRYCLSTGALNGFEALARWQHPTKGLLTPDRFSVLFTDSDVGPLIGRCIREQVVRNMRDWLDHGFDAGRISVNLSSAEFSSPRLAQDILDLLDEWKVPSHCLEIEVTETVFLDGISNRVAQTLDQLTQRGVQIALDDFGTGYASLTHLKRFPVAHMKVDQSFIRDMEHDGDDDAIVEAVIGLGRNLGLHVTAEGVETAGQVDRLRQLGCHSAQGYYFAPAMPAHQIHSLLAARTQSADGAGEQPAKTGTVSPKAAP